ncbi:hypothetical protein TrLO_g12740 [Triparma laevis f. longispina]|uniref:Uncharacterized protein n=1 Tax=Triparma laevis f. longispina TaxID=1714387 RepID=A0A9W7DQW5_9STRA|nr:hypothetical protein TrLO_g12740 [Triparma laevis f. longispina]
MVKALKNQVTKIIAALKSNATADQTAKIASLEAELKIARLEKENAELKAQNIELKAEKEITSLKQLASTNTNKKRKI